MNLTWKHAELVGLHYGDGSLIQRKGTNKLRFQLRGDAITDKAHYDNFIIPLCNELIGFPLLGREVCTITDRKHNCFGVSIESPYLLNFFNALGIKVGKKEELHIPEWITENEDFSKAFVRGLFDTDGNIAYGKNYTSKSKLHRVGLVSIACTSELLILETSKILLKIGIKNYVTKFEKNNGEKDCYRVRVYRPHHKVFMELVGSNNSKNCEKFQIGEKFGFCPPKTTPKQRKAILKGELDPISLY